MLLSLKVQNSADVALCLVFSIYQSLIEKGCIRKQFFAHIIMPLCL